MKIVLTRKIPYEYEKVLSPLYNKIVATENYELEIADADAVICQLTNQIDRSFLDKAPNLKFLATFSVGVDHLDRASLKARKIRVSHTPGVLTDATADLTWTLILGCARRVKIGISYLEREAFEGFDPNLCLGLELRGSILGIIGMGKIGRAVAERAKGFGMRVISANRGESIENLLRQSDVVSLHCPLTDQTRGLIGERYLREMKRNAILVNTARGPVIDEKALIKHLRSEPEFQAGLDVFENEPKVPRELLELPNALCLPHIGSATKETRRKMAQICVEEAVRFAEGKPLQYECLYG